MSRPANKAAGVRPSVAAPDSPARQAAIRSTLANLPLVFEPNRGQADPQVSFLARGGGYTLFLTRREAVVALSGSAPIRIRPSCSQEPQAIDGLEPTGGISNYFIGNDPARWTTRVPNYRKVQYTSVCPGVDVTYYGNPQKLEYDFTISAWTDPGTVQVEYEGAESVRVAANGDLIVKTAAGELVQHKPRAYQMVGGRQVEVEAGYRVTHGNQVEFALARYNRQQPLVIDPVLVYSTFLGGTGGDSGTSIAVDSSGNAYVTGQTQSTDFPLPPPPASPYQPAAAGQGDAFVAKISADGSTRLYATYLGGSSPDAALGIAVDTFGEAYITGLTESTNFPVLNRIQNFGGSSDAFVTKLNASGSALLYSTYLGGAFQDQGTGIAVDANQNAYVTGWTASTCGPSSVISNFPTTPGAFQTTSSAQNAFVTKLNAGGATVYSTCLGGTNGFDLANGIAVDSSFNAYITGLATSTNFPLQSAYQSIRRGPQNAFVAELNPFGSALVFSTYLGGNGTDVGAGIAVDTNGNTYVTGSTSSSNFPTVNPLQGTLAGATNAFVTKLNGAGTPVYSTYLGGSGADRGNGIAVHGGTAYVTGSTTSTNFPLQSAIDTTGFVFVAALNPAGSGLSYSTYISGGSTDTGLGIAADSTGNAYVAGFTASNNFHLFHALQSVPSSLGHAFVTVISPGGPTADSLSPASGSGSSQTFSAQFTNQGGAAAFTNAFILLSSSFTAAGSCYVDYLPGSNGLYLMNDAGTSFLGPITPGSGATLQNSQCTLNASGSSATIVGATLTLNASLTFTPAFAGAKTVFIFAYTGTANTGFQTGGTWTVTGGTPTAGPLSPNSGAGASQLFSVQYTNPGGAAAFTNAFVLFNSSFAAAGGCYVDYLPGSNGLYLMNDAGTSFLGPITPGSGATLQNSQCTLNASGSSATIVGNTLMLNASLTFKPAFAGAKTVFIFAYTGTANTGFQTGGTWTVTGGGAPTAGPLSPNSGSGASQVFSAQYTNPGGAAAFTNAFLLLNTSFSGPGACYVDYLPGSNGLFLMNDAGTSFLGPITPGSGATLQNSQCTLNASGSSATIVGTTLTLNASLTFTPAFAGTKTVFIFAYTGTANTGFQNGGTWTVTGGTPTAGPLSPNSGAGASQVFSAQYTNPGGAAAFTNAFVLLNTSFTAAGGCYVDYLPGSNGLYLMNDAGTGFLGPITPGSGATLQNSQCTLNASGSSATIVGNTLTLNAFLIFKPAFAGGKTVFIFAYTTTANTGFQVGGTWTSQ